MSQEYTIGSDFDGIGVFLEAAKRCGIKAKWKIEINEQAAAVTNARFPEARHYDDTTKVSGAELEPVDVYAWGSPCHDLSVSGPQEGLFGERSSLFFRGTRKIREMREATNGRYPRFDIWENVTGALTSGKGRDFRTVLETFAQTDVPMPRSGRWADAGMVRGAFGSLAWRVLDAQYFGCAQQRPRLFVVRHHGGERASEVLLEREGVPGRSSSEWLETTRRTVQDARSANPKVFAVDCRNHYLRPEWSGTLQAKESGSYSLNFINPIWTGDVVRMLTEVELERLNGLPDGWTDVPFLRYVQRGAVNVPRYRMNGNTIALPVAEWIMRRLRRVLDEESR